MLNAILTETVPLVEWIVPLGIIVGMTLLGLLFDRILLAKLRKVAAKTQWKWDEVVIGSLRHMMTLWLLLLGIRVAEVGLPFHERFSHPLEKALLVLLIFSLTVVSARLIVGLLRLATSQVESVLPATSIFLNIAKGTVYVVGGLIILSALNVSITPILTALGVGGLAVALALQDTLANLFAGLQIIAARQLKVGDFVQLEQGERGYVHDITWRTTTIRSLMDNMVIVPNSKLASATITNLYQPDPSLAVRIEVGVDYDSDLQKVEDATLDVARTVMRDVSGGDPEWEPVLRYTSFGDSSIGFRVILRAKEAQHESSVTHEFIKRLHARYGQEGISIPFPVRTVHLRKSQEPS